MGLLTIVFVIIALGISIPISVFCLECAIACWQKSGAKDLGWQPNSLLKVSILIPAHNEATGIRATVEALLPQLKTEDQLIVIADNCSDETAAIARQAGATVLERHNEQQRGKGYALDYGLAQLSNQPPDVVLMVDADCHVAPGGVEILAQQAAASGQPVQALYLMETPVDPSPKDSISALAFLVKNLVRPLGLAKLGFPCLLTGTGMAFPWSILQTISLASGNIVEDMQLGLDLAIAGYAPQFCSTAQVTGILPQQQDAAKSQRTRWEHGHLQTITTEVPRLLQAAIEQKRVDLLALALDLSVPPLSLLVMLWLGTLGIIGLWAVLTGVWLPSLILAVAGGLMVITIIAAWATFGRDQISGTTLLSIPVYILWKIPLYFAFLVKPQKDWVRTKRDPVNPSES